MSTSCRRAPLASYKLVLAPALAMPDSLAVARLADTHALVVLGPRSGAKTRDLTIPDGLPPGPLRALLPIRVLSVETLRPDCPGAISFNGTDFASTSWRESLDPGDAQVLAAYEDGSPALVRHGRAHYLATLTDDGFLDRLFHQPVYRGRHRHDPGLRQACGCAGAAIWCFALNYGATAVTAPAPDGAEFLLGSRTIDPHDLAIWREG